MTCNLYDVVWKIFREYIMDDVLANYSQFSFFWSVFFEMINKMSFELSLVFCLVCNRQKPCLFSRCSEKMTLQKICTKIGYFLYYWGKWNFVFSKVYSFLDGKWKVNFPPKKVHWNITFLYDQQRWYFFSYISKLKNDISCIIVFY